MNTVDRVKSLCKERGVPISRLERVLKFGDVWYIQERYRPDGNLDAVSLYNCDGGLETEQPDRDALEEWFLDNIVNER